MAFNEEKTLRIKWNKKEKWMIDYPSKQAGFVASDFLGGHTSFPDFIKELNERGYDTTSLKLTVNRRQFRCKKTFYKDEIEVFKCDEVYFLSSQDEKEYQIVSSDGFPFIFSKKTGVKPLLHEYFDEI
jgi:hypothetical protein